MSLGGGKLENSVDNWHKTMKAKAYSKSWK